MFIHLNISIIRVHRFFYSVHNPFFIENIFNLCDETKAYRKLNQNQQRESEKAVFMWMPTSYGI